MKFIYVNHPCTMHGVCMAVSSEAVEVGSKPAIRNTSSKHQGLEYITYEYPELELIQ
jgi:hypothetical protein